jgi:hypothetical protein
MDIDDDEFFLDEAFEKFLDATETSFAQASQVSLPTNVSVGLPTNVSVGLPTNVSVGLPTNVGTSQKRSHAEMSTSPTPISQPNRTSEAPQEKTSSVSSLASLNSSTTRRIPGPAGKLPRLSEHANLSTASLAEFIAKEEAKEEHVQPVINSRVRAQSQIHEDETSLFASEAWRQMLIDRGVNESDPMSPISRYSISRMKRMTPIGSTNTFPLLTCVIKSLDMQLGTNPKCVLADRTGFLFGLMHQEIVEKFGSEMHPGTVLVLKSAPLLSTVAGHYVSIQLRNLVTLYRSRSKSGLGLWKQNVCTLTTEEMEKAARILDEAEKKLGL